MSEKLDQTMDENVLTQQTDSAQTEQEEAFEQPSNVDESFLDAEVIEVNGETTVIFKNDHDDVTPIQQEDGISRVGSDFWDHDGDWKSTAVGSIGNKTLHIAKRSDGSGYKLQFAEGGDLPPLYSGWYTSFDKAQNAAQEYLNSKG